MRTKFSFMPVSLTKSSQNLDCIIKANGETMFRSVLKQLLKVCSIYLHTNNNEVLQKQDFCHINLAVELLTPKSEMYILHILHCTA